MKAPERSSIDAPARPSPAGRTALDAATDNRAEVGGRPSIPPIEDGPAPTEPHSAIAPVSPDRMRQAFCGLLVLLGLVVGLGWFLGNETLKSVAPGLSTMKLNAALCFILAGVGLEAAARRGIASRRAAVAAGIGLSTIGALTLLQYAAGVDLGIDQLLVADTGTLRGSGHPGRMSPLSAISWVVLAVAIILLARGAGRRRVVVAHILMALVGFIAFFAAAAYAFGAEAFWSLGFYSQMAVHTAIGLAVAVAAALMTRSNEGWLSAFADAPSARTVVLELLPLSLALPVTLGLVLLLGAGLGAYNAAYGFALFVPAMTLALLVLALHVARRVRTSELSLRESEALQRAIIEATPECVKIVDPGGSLAFMNAAGLSMVEADGLESVARTPIAELVDVADRRTWHDNHRRVCRGESIAWEFGITGLKGTKRRMETHAVPLQLSDGRVHQLAVTRDVTQRRADEARERLLSGEVDHRAKNLLAVVQSIVQLTRPAEPAAFREAVTGRIRALGLAHSLIAASRWSGAELRTLVSEELAPYAGADRAAVTLSGPGAWLRAEAAQTLALVIHELATNAAKYGALSMATGRVDVGWSMSCDDAMLDLVWTESGPAVSPPTTRGFGTTTIQATVERQLKGRVDFQWPPTGLRCAITLPAAEIVAGALSSVLPAQAASAVSPEPVVPGSDKILVVEDEALVAQEIDQLLAAAGFEVVGPASRVEEALALLHASPPTAALLDVNLAGERSYPIADVLRARGVPFAFCTGYAGAAAQPVRFADIPVISKPFDAREVVLAVRGLLGKGGADEGPAE